MTQAFNWVKKWLIHESKLGSILYHPRKNQLIWSEYTDLGRVVSIDTNRKSLDITRKGSEVCIKIESIDGDTPKRHGCHFDRDDVLMSKVRR